METMQLTNVNWEQLTHELGKDFEKRAIAHDKEGTFVSDNYDRLREHKFFSAAIPKELGGGGISHVEMCNIIRIIAHFCSSTA